MSYVVSYQGFKTIAAAVALVATLSCAPFAFATTPGTAQSSNQDDCTMTSRVETASDGVQVHVLDLVCPRKIKAPQDECTFVTSSRIDPDGVQVTVSDLVCPRKTGASAARNHGIATLK